MCMSTADYRRALEVAARKYEQLAVEMTIDLGRRRQFFAEEIAAVANLKTSQLRGRIIRPQAPRR